MTELRVECPVTGAKLGTGIETSAESLAAHWHRQAGAHCPSCGVEHAGIVRELFMTEALATNELPPKASRRSRF